VRHVGAGEPVSVGNGLLVLHGRVRAGHPAARALLASCTALALEGMASRPGWVEYDMELILRRLYTCLELTRRGLNMGAMCSPYRHLPIISSRRAGHCGPMLLPGSNELAGSFQLLNGISMAWRARSGAGALHCCLGLLHRLHSSCRRGGSCCCCEVKLFCWG
jgi:hypothetical protein